MSLYYGLHTDSFHRDIDSSRVAKARPATASTALKATEQIEVWMATTAQMRRKSRERTLGTRGDDDYPAFEQDPLILGCEGKRGIISIVRASSELRPRLRTRNSDT